VLGFDFDFTVVQDILKSPVGVVRLGSPIKVLDQTQWILQWILIFDNWFCNSASRYKFCKQMQNSLDDRI